MEKGDIVKYKPTGEIGIVVWHDENKKTIDVRLSDEFLVHKYIYDKNIKEFTIYDKNIKQFTVLGDYKWEQ